MALRQVSCQELISTGYTVCKGGGILGSGPQTDKHLAQSPFIGQFFRLRHFPLPSMSLIYLWRGKNAAKQLGKFFTKVER